MTDLLASLAGCSSETPTAASTDGSEPTAAASSDDTIKVAYVVSDMSHEWCQNIIKGAKIRAEELGMELQVVDSAMDVTKRVIQAENILADGVDVECITPIDPKAPAAVIYQATASGVPIVSESNVIDGAAIYVGIDNLTAATAAGTWLAGYAKNNGIDPKILIVGQPAYADCRQRVEEFKKGMDDAGLSYTIVQEVDGGGGQLDELLRPYYEKNLSEGRIIEEEAIFYLACLLLNDLHYYQLGGPDENGKDVTSKISYMILEAADAINSSCNITIRVHDVLDEGIFRKSAKYLKNNKNGWPRYSGDKALVKGFTRCGYNKELARKRIAVGCHWMSLPGLEYTLNYLVRINTPKVFECAFDDMKNETNRSVEKLWELFEKHLENAVALTAEGIDFHLKHQVENEPELVLNLLSHGPVEKGRDVSDGGAEYYNIAIIDGAGIAVVADSFGALQQRIENEGKITWNEIAACVDSNFSEIRGEYVRNIMLSCPHYGSGNSFADEWRAMVNAICKVQCGYGNTVPIQLEFAPGILDESESLDKVASLIKGVFENGATLLNTNVIDANQILEAHKDPCKYPDLIVRVTGFTAYFCMLSENFRQ